jgi:hypothetical protein
MKLTNQLILLIFLIFTGVIEVIFFLNNVGGIDQIRHLSWVYFLSNSDHFLPVGFFYNYKTIYNDVGGFVYELLRYSYKDVGHILNVVPILITYCLSFIFGLKPYLLNLTSIIFSTLSIFLSYRISLKFFDPNEIKQKKIFSILFILLFSVSYIFYFSSLGIHNISLFFFLLTVNYFLDINNYENFKNNFNLSLLIALASYSHKINALLLPVPIILFILFSSGTKYQKIKSAVLLGINLTIFFLPILILIYFSESTVDDNLNYAAIKFNFTDILINFKSWFYIHLKNIGYINFIISCFSLIYFLFFRKKKNIDKIFILIFFHLFLSLFISGFLNYHIRTTLYSTFILLIINFIFIVNLTKNNHKLAIIFLAILFFSFSQQAYMIINTKNFFKKRPDIYNFYFKNIENIKFSSLNESIISINKKIPKDGKIIFYSNLSEDIYLVYSNRNLKNIKYKFLKPIKNLIYYQRNNQLEKYLKKINYNKVALSNTYILSITNFKLDIVDNFNELDKSKIFINNCQILNKIIYENKIFISGERKLFLHKISCN